MARMKAKPFIHRLPIGPVSALKNGFRLTSPPATVYDPNTAAAAVAYSAAPQRFVYAANGAAMTQPPVPYNAPLHLIVSIDFPPYLLISYVTQYINLHLFFSAISTATVLS